MIPMVISPHKIRVKEYQQNDYQDIYHLMKLISDREILPDIPHKLKFELLSMLNTFDQLFPGNYSVKSEVFFYAIHYIQDCLDDLDISVKYIFAVLSKRYMKLSTSELARKFKLNRRWFLKIYVIYLQRIVPQDPLTPDEKFSFSLDRTSR